MTSQESAKLLGLLKDEFHSQLLAPTATSSSPQDISTGKSLEDEHEDEHDAVSGAARPSELRKQLSSQLASNHLPVPPKAPSKPAPLLASSRARATSGFFAKSTLDPECGEMMRPSLILGLLYFRHELSVEKCRDILTNRLVLEFRRFRSKIVLEKNDIFFQELSLDNMDMNYHCQEISAEGWGQKELDTFLSSQYKYSKPSDSPLWVFYVLNNLEDGRSCLVANIDHCIGDGISMVQVLMSLLDDDDGHEDVKISHPSTVSEATKSANSQTDDSKNEAEEKLKKKKPHTVVSYPRISFAEKVYVFMRGVVMGVVGPLLPGDTPNMLKLTDPCVAGVERTCSFGEKISLAKVKEIKNKFKGTTVNDILSAVLNMAVRRYYENECASFLNSSPKVRALFPINMRRKGADVRGSLGNRFSSGVFQFFFDYKSRTDLVWRVKHQVDRIKISPQPLVELFLLQSLFPWLSGKAITDLTLSTFGKFTMTLSNVPGPQSPAHFGGQEIDDLSFIACSPIGLYCGLLSYNGKVSCGLCSDPTAEREPEKVTRYWKEEFDKLYEETMAFEGDVPPPKEGIWRKHVFSFAAMVLLSAVAISYYRSP